MNEGNRGALRFFLMKLGFSFKMATHGLLAKPLRTGLTVLGVTIGVASIVALMGIGEGARSAVLQQFESLGSNVIKISAYDKAYEFEPEFTTELRERVEEVLYISPIIEAETKMQWKRTKGSMNIIGVNEQFMEIRGHEIVQGDFLAPYHIKLRANVAVVGSNVAKTFMGARSPVGRYVTLGGESYEIIGVLKEKGKGKADGVDDKIIIPYTCAQKIADKRTVESIWVKANSEDGAKIALVKLSRIVKKKFNIASSGPISGDSTVQENGEGEGGEAASGDSMDEGMMDMGMEGMDSGMMDMEMEGVAEGMMDMEMEGMDEPTPEPDSGDQKEVITITNMNDMVKEADEANRIMTLLLGGIAAVSLLVGGLGVMNIMLVSVSERTGEIGVRRALGAQKPDLLLQFMLEALLLCLAGSLAGILLGIGGVFMFESYGFQAIVSVKAIGIATGVSVGSGLIFGVWPAMSAASIPPVEALRRN